MISVGEYLVGLVVAVSVVGPLWFAAIRLHKCFGPAWQGALARLSESIVGIALLLALSQTLGAIGLLGRVPLVIGALVIGGGVWITTRERASVPRRSRRGHFFPWRRPDARHVATAAGVAAVVCIVATPWIGRTLIALRTGVLGFDSLNYHLPFAARFAQDGSITALHFTIPGLETAFHPANSELIHAVGMVALQTDVLSPIMNLGWVALALLAAWCVGLSRRVQLATLAGAAVLLSCPLFVAFDGGRATNDIVGCALLLGAVAVLLNGAGESRAIGLAAIAAGLALGDKLTLVVPVAALTVGVIVAARVRAIGRELRGVWLPWLVLTGGFWYVRNLVTVGSPIPAVRLGLGPVSLPTTEIRRATPSYGVAHYLLDASVWRDWFGPGIRSSLGWLGPLVLVLAAAGWMLAIVFGDRLVRMLGLVGVTGFVGYLVTPQTAGGAGGHPVLFAANLRFAFPAMLLGLVLLPLALPARSRVVRWWLPAGLAGVALVNVARYAVDSQPSIRLSAALAVELALIGVAVLVTLASMRGPLVGIATISVVLLAAAAFGLVGQRAYLARRYKSVASAVPYASAPREELDLIYSFGRSVSDARIAIAGADAQYPLYGRDLSNRVQYVGHRGAHGSFDRARSCEEWRREINQGDYDYIVTTGETPRAKEPVEAKWTRSDGAATPIEEAGTATIFRVDGRLDPDTCPPLVGR